MMLAARKMAGKTKTAQLESQSGTQFVETMVGRSRELERTQRFMQSVWLCNMRFNANCEGILNCGKS